MKRKNNIMKWIGTLGAILIVTYSQLKTETESSEPPVNTNKLEIPAGKGKKGQIVQRIGYTLSYDTKNRTPLWVAWELTKEETRGNIERADAFLTDPQIKGVQADTYDYSRSGYDRGHMAPAGDMKWSEEAMQESFYMSNICPQNHNLNKGDWNDLEIKAREWARRYGKAYVVCGPVYKKGETIQRIGKNRVAVPHAFFKAVLLYRKNTPLTLGFLFDNEAGNHPLTDYLVSIDHLEELTELDFFPALPDHIEEQIEKIKADKLP